MRLPPQFYCSSHSSSSRSRLCGFLFGWEMRDRGKSLEMYGGFEDSGSRCRKHPSQPSAGICALCLKDRLSKLVCSDCGERRPSSCSCSEASSSSDAAKTGSGKTGTVDIGSVGRISFLIESDKGDPEDPLIGNFRDVKARPSKPDAIVLLKRSKSAACGTTAAPAAGSASAALDSKVCALRTHPKKPHFWSLLYFVKRKEGGKIEGSGPESKPAQRGAVYAEQGLDGSATGEICDARPGNGNENPSPLWGLPFLGSRLFRSRSVGCGRSSFSMDGDDGEDPARLVTDRSGREGAPPARPKQPSRGNPIDRVLSTAEGREGCDVKARGRLAGFGKAGGAFHSISSTISDNGNRTPGARSAWGRGWSWRLPSTIRVFRNSSRSKASREAKNSHGDSVSQEAGNASASSAGEAGALIGIDRG